jgi:hypothetical protein
MRATRRRITVVLICVASAFTCEIALGEHHKQRSGPPEQFSADNHRGHSTARGQFPPHHPTDVSSGEPILVFSPQPTVRPILAIHEAIGQYGSTFGTTSRATKK